MKYIYILGLSITSITFFKAIELVKEWLRKKEKKYYIVTPNPEAVIRARTDNRFREIINQADLALCDGVGIYWAGKFLGVPFEERITGVDFMLGICKMAEKEGFSIGLLGAGPGVALKTAKKLREKYPKLKVNFVSEEWNRENSNLQIKEEKSKVDILFVAFGMPKQEKWISENLKFFPASIFMGVGGSFDYLSGLVPRAPAILRKAGLEWLYRLIQQPYRWKRQMALIKFILLVFKEKFFG